MIEISRGDLLTLGFLGGLMSIQLYNVFVSFRSREQRREQNKINALFEGFIRDFAGYKNIEPSVLRTGIMRLNPNDITGIFNALQAHNLALPTEGEAPPVYIQGN